jgi:hypothetical protein
VHYQKKGPSKAAAEHSFAKRGFSQAQAKVLLAKLCSVALPDTLEFKRSTSGKLTLTGDTKLSAVWNQPLQDKSSREVKKLMKSVCIIRWLILGKHNTLDEFIKIVPIDIFKKIHWCNFLLLNIHSLMNMSNSAQDLYQKSLMSNAIVIAFLKS